jgi:cation transport ATPase
MSGRAPRSCALALALLALLAAPAGAAGTKTVVLDVEGMVCTGSEATVEQVAGAVDRVVAVDADRDAQVARVAFTPGQTTPADVAAALNRNTYYRASVRTSPTAEPAVRLSAPHTSSDGRGWLVGLALATMVVAAAALALRRRQRRV